MTAPRPALRQALAPFGTSIFGEMTRLANEHRAINLSQGFPDFDGPDFIREAAIEAVRRGPNQYARSMGHLDLVSAVARKVLRHYGLELDPLRQVVVFSGATEGIFASIMGLIDPGDEVILFEPFYDSYPASVVMAGGTPRYCTLRWPDFRFDPAELEALFSPRTRLLVLNTPHNPTGKVFSREELELIGALCRRHDVRVLADEVYEHLTYDGHRHIPMATLPGMAERTLTLSSSGKTFSLTGWKIGWGYGPAELVGAAQAAHQFITFATATPLQQAVVTALDAPDSYYAALQQEYLERRDFLVRALREVGFQVAVPAGTYFILADFTPFGFDDDLAFTRHLTTEIGVACIPPSVFYKQDVAEGKKRVRFAFCKKLETLEQAAQRLARLRRG